MAIYQVIEGESVVFTFRANFSDRDGAVQTCEADGSGRVGTPFRVSDSRSVVGAARLINGWHRAKGRRCWAKGARGLVLRRVL
jgi:hypothetical protein